MTETVPQAMARFQPRLPLAVGYSGGADSTALLLACARAWPAQVVAFHIHHGLQAAADGFEAHARATCARLGLPLCVRRVNAQPAVGQSPEDAARRARYAGFLALAQDWQAQHALFSIALGQHADDQAETALLALGRGAGLPGLAAMPAHWQRDGLDWHRPLLRVARADLRRWLAEQDQTHVEDPSNTDLRYTRNRLRAQALPALQAIFPAALDTLARSAAHAAQAQALLTEVAAEDLLRVGVPPNLAALQTLSPARLANVLRHWLARCHATQATQAQLQELQRQIQAARTRAQRIAIRVGAGWCVRRGESLDWYTQPVLSDPHLPATCP